MSIDAPVNNDFPDGLVSVAIVAPNAQASSGWATSGRVAGASSICEAVKTWDICAGF